jgi:transcriptional regulator with XRE-family HTH domain
MSVIDYAINHKGWSEKKLAEALKVSPDEVSSWRKNEMTSMSQEYLEKVMDLIDAYTSNGEWMVVAPTKEDSDAWMEMLSHLAEKNGLKMFDDKGWSAEIDALALIEAMSNVGLPMPTDAPIMNEHEQWDFPEATIDVLDPNVDRGPGFYVEGLSQVMLFLKDYLAWLDHFCVKHVSYPRVFSYYTGLTYLMFDLSALKFAVIANLDDKEMIYDQKSKVQSKLIKLTEGLFKELAVEGEVVPVEFGRILSQIPDEFAGNPLKPFHGKG